MKQNHVRLIGFHGNDSEIYDVTNGHHPGFLNFQILFKFEFFVLQNDEETAFSN